MENKIVQKTEGLFDSKTPERKLYTLTMELKISIDVIRGYANLLKKDIESNQIDPEDILKKINTIAETAEKIKRLYELAVRAQ